MNERLTLTSKQIDAILPYLDRFTEGGFTPGTWHTQSDGSLWLEPSEFVSEFQKTLYDTGWINAQFDWPEWQETAQEYVANREKIASADAGTVQKLFTTHVRKERFCEGHLAAMFENGHIVALLQRLKELRSNKKSASE